MSQNESQIVNITEGKQALLRRGSIQFNTTYVESGKRIPSYNIFRGGKMYSKAGFLSSTPSFASSKGLREDICGRSAVYTHHVSNGAYMMVTAILHAPDVGIELPLTAAVMLRFEKSAPMNKLYVFPMDEDNATFGEYSVTGRFSIVSANEVITNEGLNINRDQVLWFTKENVRRIFKFTQLEAASGTAKRVVTDEGVEVTRIVIDRNSERCEVE